MAVFSDTRDNGGALKVSPVASGSPSVLPCVPLISDLPEQDAVLAIPVTRPRRMGMGMGMVMGMGMGISLASAFMMFAVPLPHFPKKRAAVLVARLHVGSAAGS